MPFEFKSKSDFVILSDAKKCYYLARLYIYKDKERSNSKISYQQRLFTCANWLKKQDKPILSILYNYLSDKSTWHSGQPLWKLLPKAVLYDQEQRRINGTKKIYKDFNKDMLDDILKEG
jgi:hypothetical protein